MEFQWFNPVVGTPIVSIAEYGIAFNSAAAIELGNPERIKLVLNREHKVIGVKPMSNVNKVTERETFIFAERERNGYVRINNKDFVRLISLYCPEFKFDKTIRFSAKWDDTEQILIVDLNNVIDGQFDKIQEPGEGG